MEMDGAAMKAHRQRALMTQQELAVKAGVSRDTVARIEGGRANGHHPGTIKKLARALKVTPRALLKEAEGDGNGDS